MFDILLLLEKILFYKTNENHYNNILIKIDYWKAFKKKF